MNGGDIVACEQSDPVAGAFDLGFCFNKDVTAGAAAFCTFCPEKHWDGAEVGGEAARGVELFGALRRRRGAWITFIAKLSDGIHVGSSRGETEPFFQG